MKDLKFLLVEVGMTDADIDRLILLSNDDCLKSNTPYFLTVAGFDTDHRNLWQIPEANELLRRLSRAGCLSVLHVKDLRDQSPTIGAYELWAIVNGHVQDNCLKVSRELFAAFTVALAASNELVDKKSKGQA